MSLKLKLVKILHKLEFKSTLYEVQVGIVKAHLGLYFVFYG